MHIPTKRVALLGACGLDDETAMMDPITKNISNIILYINVCDMDKLDVLIHKI